MMIPCSFQLVNILTFEKVISLYDYLVMWNFAHVKEQAEDAGLLGKQFVGYVTFC
jgi:hypothetical protein